MEIKGKSCPRAIRNLIRAKRVRLSSTYKPSQIAPPSAWSASRKQRLTTAIKAAALFLMHDCTWHEVRDKLGEEGRFANENWRNMTRSRIQQYIVRGTKFLVERGVFVVIQPKEPNRVEGSKK